MGDNKRDSGKRLRELRNSLKLTQMSLSKELGCGYSKQNIWDWERNGVPLEQAFVIADFFGVTLDYLYCRSDSKNGEAMGTEEYTGLSARAASKLHWIYEDDKIRKQKNEKCIAMSDVISRIIILSAGFIEAEVHSLAFAAHETLATYRPFYALSGENASDKPLQRENLSNADRALQKARGYSETLCGERLLIYKTRMIADHFAKIVAESCGVDAAVKHCRIIDAEQRKREDRQLLEFDGGGEERG